MKYGYIAIIAMASVAACVAPASSSEEANAVESASSSCSPAYGQCGGQGSTGATCCVSGYTCQFGNQWYSQCVPGGGGSSSGSSSGSPKGGGNSCPQHSAQDDVNLAAATVALKLMQAAAVEAAGRYLPPEAYSVLAPQRYRVQSSGTGIEFDPTDPLYGHVSNQMKAALAIAQMDSTVAQFLSDGLKYAYANSNGQTFPSIPAIQALSGYTYPGPVKVHISDNKSADDSHNATVSGQASGCTTVVSISETVQNSWQFAPMYADYFWKWRKDVPWAFKGSSSTPTTPFNGPSASGNPFLVVSVDGKTTNWATYNFTPINCYDYPGAKCVGSIQIDPIPYAQPADYYDSSGIVVGPQANPFALTVTNLYADPSHAGQWATRTVGGVQQWGTFSHPVNVLGTTVYQYVKQM